MRGADRDAQPVQCICLPRMIEPICGPRSPKHRRPDMMIVASVNGEPGVQP
jgi:hypothetical protein